MVQSIATSSPDAFSLFITFYITTRTESYEQTHNDTKTQRVFHDPVQS